MPQSKLMKEKKKANNIRYISNCVSFENKHLFCLRAHFSILSFSVIFIFLIFFLIDKALCYQSQVYAFVQCSKIMNLKFTDCKSENLIFNFIQKFTNKNVEINFS